MLGLAVDLGRLYITKNEAQAYVDSAALRATLELDGTMQGLNRATASVASNTNTWNMGTSPFTGTVTEFSKTPLGPWEASPGSADGYGYVRVKTRAQLPLYFVTVLVAETSKSVAAQATAGQVPRTRFADGVLPFSPIAHVNADPNFGFTKGELYTLRWASNSKVNVNVCAGDNAQQWIDMADAGGSQERGYIEDTSSSVIRRAIEDDYQTRSLEVGDVVTMTGGAKQTQRDSLINRANQDTDTSATRYADYAGNGRRLVVAPINSGVPGRVVLGFAAFFVPMDYLQGGNRPFCAEYVGPYVRGSAHRGSGDTGAYEVKLLP